MTRLATLLICFTLALFHTAMAQGGTGQGGSELLPGAQLPAGETAAAMAWPDAHTLCIIVQSSDGFAVRDLDIRSGEFSVVTVPPSFKRLRPGAVRFVFADDASGVVALGEAAGALQPGELGIFRRTGNKLEGVELRGIPANFWTAQAAWGRSGELFLAARRYLNPEQPYSVGRLDVTTGKFEGVVLKGNLDLVDQLIPLPARNQLLLRCWGIRGEYPQEPVIAAWDLGKPESQVLHSRARYLEIEPLDSAQALLRFTRSNADDGERWILQQGQSSLRRLERGMAARSLSMRLTRDASWLVVLIAGSELSPELAPAEHYVAMQELATGRTLATAVPCELFAVSPDGTVIATLAKGGQKVYYYSLPAAASKTSAGSAAEPTADAPSGS